MAFSCIFVISTFAAMSLATLRSCPVVVFTAKIFVWNASSFFSMFTCLLSRRRRARIDDRRHELNQEPNQPYSTDAQQTDFYRQPELFSSWFCCQFKRF